MSRIAYVDGAYVAHAAAAVHIEDRGNQFADAVYEVWSVKDGALMDSAGHFKRLSRSLRELRIREPMDHTALACVLFEMVRRNRLRDGLIYLQISRGRARRDHAFPSPEVKPTVIVTAKRGDPAAAEAKAQAGIRVITLPDLRWARRDIKTVSLLPNALAKQAAKEAGAQEAWLVGADGFITEGTASNAWILTADGALVTRMASEAILNGVTRLALLQVAREEGLRIEERPFTVAEAMAASEAFVTSASSALTAVVSIDGQKIGAGAPGPLAKRLRHAYLAGAASNVAAQKPRPSAPLVARRARARIG